MNYSPLGSSVRGILQTRILEWVAIPFSRDLHHLGIKTTSPALQAVSSLSLQGSPKKHHTVKWQDREWKKVLDTH